MASNMHNTRLLRFLIVVTIVVLTIFIYASYSSTQTLSPPPMRNSAAASLMAFSMTTNNRSNNNEGSLEAGVLNSLPYDGHNKATNVKNSRAVGLTHYSNLPPGGGGSHGGEVVLIKKLSHHREPTIDENAIDGGGEVGGVGVVGASGAMADDVVADDTALEHFNNNNNDLLQEEQYVQSVDNNLGNINNSVSSAGTGVASGTGDAKRHKSPEGLDQQSYSNNHHHHEQQQQQQPQKQLEHRQSQSNTNNLNKIPDSDVLIPTSNLQKFIESADKILKNITNQQQLTPTSEAKAPEKYYLPLDPANDDNDLLDDNDEALPPSVIMTIKGGAGSSINNPSQIEVKQPQKAVAAAAPAPAVPAVSPGNSAKITSTTKKVPKVQADPTQGIPTEQIYEPGHMNEEIDVEQICPNKGNKLKLLILITSAQTHTEARLAIRQTWGHFGTRRDVSTAFILGRTTNATVSEALTQENIIYGDLIRGNFIDSYNNLTLKTLSSLEWVDQHCPKAKYILKTDDDMFINVPKLLQFLDAHSKDKRVIYGRLAKKWKPIRNKKSKYYISTGQFNAAVFPPFTTGPAYVLTSDIVHELYEKSLEQVYLKLEDVFTTGIVAQLLGIKRVHVNEFLNRRIAFNPCNIRKSISVHMIKANEQFDLWKKLLDQTTKCK
ncbi:UDP-GlcNAc:betaGal beta-1,3-N-acetylglucosaminyltransferase 9 [Stomoxys calcitrans]|uniref:UDP-GlcNAc:betaGal beta-1,3-N-acetylglucosaminyltransferase 9 n=1 Tax=Stomoxys calcitrans TaxID=35570 RepID=UPI0027E339F0|nr:UDP-GlcNAc:betaGal beta-1,3-N-acetylglucosaminyltransferase 9 [Stomoxys calcitrans]